jgi:hypothetical protein
MDVNEIDEDALQAESKQGVVKAIENASPLIKLLSANETSVAKLIENTSGLRDLCWDILGTCDQWNTDIFQIIAKLEGKNDDQIEISFENEDKNSTVTMEDTWPTTEEESSEDEWQLDDADMSVLYGARQAGREQEFWMMHDHEQLMCALYAARQAGQEEEFWRLHAFEQQL